MKQSEAKNNSEIIFGLRPIIEAIKTGKEIEKVLLQTDGGQSELLAELTQQARLHGVPIQRVPIYKLNKITRKNHQGVIAFISAIQYASLDNVIAQTFSEGKQPLVLILDRITDVRNFGAIARTAECMGVNALIVPEKNAAQINSDAVKTSAGALLSLPVCRSKNLYSTVRFLQDSGLQIVACTEKAEENLYEMDFSTPLAVILGSEEDGIATDLLKKADMIAKIPMVGQIESLNVSVSAGIILYEIVKQRKNA